MLMFFCLIISPKHSYETKQTINLSKFEAKARRVFLLFWEYSIKKI